MTLQTQHKKSGIVSFEFNNQIGVLTLFNGSQNKIPRPEFLQLNILKELLSAQELKGIIITGQGRHFSAGADVDNIKDNRDDLNYLEESLNKGKEILNYIESLPIITVAAISGVCFGGGLEIALSCQFRVGTNNTLMAFPESNLGIMPGLAGTIRLSRIVGKKRALEIIISGRIVEAKEANELGLIDKIVPNKQHLSAAIEFINELSQNKSIHQIRNIVQSLNNADSQPEEIAMVNEGKMFIELVKNL